MNPFSELYKSDKDDVELIDLAVRGDKSALEELIKKHQPYIFNIAWKMSRDSDLAQDLTQEVLIKVTTKLSQFKHDSEFRTWLYRIVVNHFLQAKKSEPEGRVGSFEDFGNILSSIPDVELTELEQREKEAEIKEMNLACMSAMLLCLTREQRMVYILGELFGAGHAIGSEVLGITKENFRVRLSRARKDLLSFMNNKCGLVNKSNPCRCYKKVTAMINNKRIDAKNMLFNREEHESFKTYISKKADDALTMVEEKYRELHELLPFRKNFDRKTFLEEIISDEKVISIYNLN